MFIKDAADAPHFMVKGHQFNRETTRRFELQRNSFLIEIPVDNHRSSAALTRILGISGFLRCYSTFQHTAYFVAGASNY